MTARQLARFLKRSVTGDQMPELRVERGSGPWDYTAIWRSPAADRATWPHPTPYLKRGYLVDEMPIVGSGIVHGDQELPPLPPPEVVEGLRRASGGQSYSQLDLFIARNVSMRWFEYRLLTRHRGRSRPGGRRLDALRFVLRRRLTNSGGLRGTGGRRLTAWRAGRSRRQ